MSTLWVLTDRRYLRQRMPSALAARLTETGVATRTIVAEDVLVGLADDALGTLGHPWAGVADGDAVIARSRNRFALSLLAAVESRSGIDVLTPFASIAAVRDKPRALVRLAELGLPMPPTFLAHSPPDLALLGQRSFPMLLKPHAGDNAVGITLVRTPAELDDVPWSDVMVVGQQFVETDGYDLKIYVIGERVWGVRRPSPLALATRPRAGARAERVEVDDEQREIALACGRAFDLQLLGVDVLESVGGPLVVDVNEFPNYTGIEEAPAIIADLVRSQLDSGIRA